MTILEHEIMMTEQLRRVPADELQVRLNKFRADVYKRQGQRQALTLLMATLIKPKLLLLDEHTAALDPKTAARCV